MHGVLQRPATADRMDPGFLAALTGGGDSRLAIDPSSGCNQYLCPPTPAPWIACLGSCTASPISETGFARARTVYESGSVERLRADIAGALLAGLGAAGLTDVVLVPSGTDGILLCATMLALEGGGRPITAVLPDAAETGTHVPRAAACRGFDATHGFDVTVPGAAIRIVEVKLRSDDGRVRDDDAIAEDFAAAAQTAPGRAVIYLTHGSKTGLVAPLRVPSGVDVVVDACQMRLAPDVLRDYLRQGWPVVITGSKFLCGPPFSGGVLIPHGRFGRVRAEAERACGLGEMDFGPPLRWSAGLEGLPALTGDGTGGAMARLAEEAEAMLAALPVVPVSGPSLAMRAASRWPSGIITFAVRGSDGGMLEKDELLPLHRALWAADMLIGQPVGLGRIGGLRVAIGARNVLAGGIGEELGRLRDLLEGCLRR